jgi:predicted cupin superfamily sugar epimerase
MADVSDVDGIIATLDMRPHPEGGHYVETWRGPDGGAGRAVASAIYFLLRQGERSHWHRVDADEVWLHHAGSPLRLSVAVPGSTTAEHLLGPDLAAGQRPQAVVPAAAWQAAEPIGDFSLVSCVVAPGFDFAGFELAATDWTPG